MTNNLIGIARVDRRDRFVGPNFLAVNNNRIFLAELRPHVRDRGAHAFLILFVDEIHERRVLVTIARRCVEGSAVSADFEMSRAVRTLRDEIGWVT